jgi:putative ABC transport system permease protein
VTAGYLRTLGVEPTLGRLFTAEEDRPGGPAIVLLGHGLWRRRFGSDPGVVGRVLTFEEGPHAVVGVLPAGFDVPYSAEAWVPMQAAVASLPLDQRAATANEFVARLAPGVSLAQADAELKRLARLLELAHPQVRRGWSFGIVPLRQQLMADIDGRTRRSLVALGIAVACLLLACCSNVACLLLARGAMREGEMAIRLSLGAGSARLTRQVLAESMLLALLGGGLGAALAFTVRPLLAAMNPIQVIGLGSHLTDFRLDGRVLAFSLLTSLATGAIFGAAAAWRAIRPRDQTAALKLRSQSSAGGRAGRLLGILVACEIAVAVTLLAGGGLMTKSFLHLRQLDLGFRPERLMTVEIPLSPLRHETVESRARFVQDLLRKVRTVPGVLLAGITTNVPLQRGVLLDSVFDVQGRPRANPADVPITAHRLVSPGYLETLGVVLEAGRFLDEYDRDGSPLVVVVSRELARQAWPDEDPLGKRIRRVRSGEAGPWMVVVGVVKDVKEDRFGFRSARPAWYLPYAQQAVPLPSSLPLNLVLRTGGDAPSVAPAVREAIRAVDPAQVVGSVAPMSEHLSDVLLAERFGAALMGTLALLGLTFSALGLYGVMAYSVSQRQREIGLRMALGARPGDLLRLFLGEGSRLVGLGLAFGLLGAFALARILASTLHEVSRADYPPTLLIVSLVLGLTALAACWLPARRAARMDPMSALRAE